MPYQQEPTPLFIDLNQEQLSTLEKEVLAALIRQELPPPNNIKLYKGPTKLAKINKDEQGQKIPYLIQVDQKLYSVTLSHSLMMRISEKLQQNPIRYEVLPNSAEKNRKENPLLAGKGVFGKVVIVLKKIILGEQLELKNHRLPRAMKIITLHAITVSGETKDKLIEQFLDSLRDIFTEHQLLRHVYNGVKNLIVRFSRKTDALKVYILMPLFTGKSLQTWLEIWEKGEQTKSLLERLQMMNLIARATDYLHRQQIIHQDLKPGNIIYDEDMQTLHIADFGMAILSKTSEDQRFSRGTAEYIAMETLLGKTATFAVDTFANGGIFAQLLSKIPMDVVLERSQKKLDSLDKTSVKSLATFPNYNLASVLQDPELVNQCAATQQKTLIDFIARMTNINPDERPTDAEIIEFTDQQIQVLSQITSQKTVDLTKPNQKNITFKPIGIYLDELPLIEIETVLESPDVLSKKTIKIALISCVLMIIGLSIIIFAPPIILFGIAGLLTYAGIAIAVLGTAGFFKMVYEIFRENQMTPIIETAKPTDDLQNCLAKFNHILGFELAAEQFIVANQFDQSGSSSSKPFFKSKADGSVPPNETSVPDVNLIK